MNLQTSKFIRFKKTTWNKFEQAGLIPNKKEYQKSRKEITLLGQKELPKIKEIIGFRIWDQFINKNDKKIYDDDTVRILGFGVALTEYLISPLNINDKRHYYLLRLGALTNLIITLFDWFVDSGLKRDKVLSVNFLKNVSALRIPGFLKFMPLFKPLYSKVVMKLVIHFYTLARGNSFLNLDQVSITKVNNFVFEMYKADEFAQVKNSSKSSLFMSRKAALPFITMGLPGFFVKKSTKITYFGYLKWLYQVGIFFGYVDDIIDYYEDISNNEPNQIHHFISNSNEECEAELENISEYIAKIGKGVTGKWHQYQGILDIPPGSRDAFRTCLVSWWGGFH